MSSRLKSNTRPQPYLRRSETAQQDQPVGDLQFAGNNLATTDLPLVLNPEEVRAILRMGRTAFYNALHTNQIPSIRIGHLWKIPRDSLLVWLVQSGQFSSDNGQRGEG
jgi:excisionase family DNA binding protein